MDIKEIAEQVSKRIYVEDGLLLSKFISEKFAEALIESYKDELLKEVGEPVAEVIWFDPALELFPSKQPHKIIDGSMSFMDSSKIGTKFYTSDQVAAAVAKATKPLEEEIQRLKVEGSIYKNNNTIRQENHELRAKLAAAQEEIERLNGQISVYRLSFVELERQRDVEMASATRWATGYHELRDQLTALKAENESLRKDAERLDWVEHQDFHDLSFAILVDQPNDGMTAVSISEGWYLGNNLREAIDAAMVQGEQ